jgi:hypothetical protein
MLRSKQRFYTNERSLLWTAAENYRRCVARDEARRTCVTIRAALGGREAVPLTGAS